MTGQPEYIELIDRPLFSEGYYTWEVPGGDGLLIDVDRGTGRVLGLESYAHPFGREDFIAIIRHLHHRRPDAVDTTGTVEGEGIAADE